MILAVRGRREARAVCSPRTSITPLFSFVGTPFLRRKGSIVCGRVRPAGQMRLCAIGVSATEAVRMAGLGGRSGAGKRGRWGGSRSAPAGVTRGPAETVMVSVATVPTRAKWGTWCSARHGTEERSGGEPS